MAAELWVEVLRQDFVINYERHLSILDGNQEKAAQILTILDGFMGCPMEEEKKKEAKYFMASAWADYPGLSIFNETCRKWTRTVQGANN